MALRNYWDYQTCKIKKNFRRFKIDTLPRQEDLDANFKRRFMAPDEIVRKTILDHFFYLTVPLNFSHFMSNFISSIWRQDAMKDV